MASLGGKGLKDIEYMSHIRTSACQAVVMIDLNPSIKVTIHLTIFCKHILSVHKCKILYKCCVTLIDYSCNIVAFKFHVNITQLSHQSKHSNFSLYSDPTCCGNVWVCIFMVAKTDKHQPWHHWHLPSLFWNNQKLQAIRNVCLPLKHPMKRGKHKHKD